MGVFRALRHRLVLAAARAAAGLADATAVLSCVGSSVPTADWTRFAADAATIPTSCASGGGVLAERAPSVTLIDPGYDVPHSWRASLDWNSSYGSWLLRAGVLGSYDLSQPGTVDANFSGTQRFTLTSEGNRPVHVSAAAIDPSSGAVSAAESRHSDQYGPVALPRRHPRGHGGH